MAGRIAVGERFESLSSSSQNMLKSKVNGNDFNEYALLLGFIDSELASLRKFIGALVEVDAQSVATEKPGVVITQEDVDFLNHVKQTYIMQFAMFEIVSSSSDYSLLELENEKNENKTKAQSIAAAKEISFGKNYDKLYCAISGEVVDADEDKKLDRNHPERIVCQHLVSLGAMNNVLIVNMLNKGFGEEFDFNSPRNMVFVKGKYASGMNARKMSIEWTQKDGLTVFIDERFREEYPNIHGRKLAMYLNGRPNISPEAPNWPYRRAIAYHLAITQERTGELFQIIKTASVGGDIVANKSKDIPLQNH